MVGIIQEQHPDRARLFMQWKRMGWPILIDSLNLLEVSAVPMTFALDEQGIIRHARLPVAAGKTIEDTFIGQSYPSEAQARPSRPVAPDLAGLAAGARGGTFDRLRAYADALVMWAGAERLNEAIVSYERAAAIRQADGFTRFRLGVAYRKRYDSAERQPTDFQRAVEAWSRALEIDPNQYIFRRRIQQFGPRLSKPYPFYDWVPVARREIAARGERAVPLAIEPGDGEYAAPLKTFETAAATMAPDPEGRILRDAGEFIEVETVVVPSVLPPGGSARVHVTFRPRLAVKAHWNNEVDGLAFWIGVPDGWAVDRQSQVLPNPAEVTSQEPRRVEFEVRAPEDVRRPAVFETYAVYYVCEDVDGICLYRRQDIPVRIEIHDVALP
jgi:hypothetical protein